LKDYENALEQELQQLENDTTVQIAILTIPSLEGEDISAYAGKVFDTWKIGQADVDNGLLIVVSLQDREYFFQTGYGLEGTLPDIVLGRMGRDILVPYFRGEEYGAGITAVVREMESYIRNDPSIVSKYSSPAATFEVFELGIWIIGIWLALFVSFLVKVLFDMRGDSKNVGLLVVHLILLLFFGIFTPIFIGVLTMAFLNGFYGFTLSSIAILYLIIFTKAPYFSVETLATVVGVPGFGRNRGGGFGGFGSGGFGGGGFGGGMSGGGGAGGKW
jgi:uncharacterized protein